MEYHYPENINLQRFPAGSSSCMAEVNKFTQLSDSYSNPIFHFPDHTTVLLPIHPSYDFNFQYFPSETGHQDTEVLLQCHQFQDIYGTAIANHQEPPRTTSAADVVEEPILRGFSELCEKLSKSIRKGIKNLERLKIICVPNTRTRGLNVGCTSTRGLHQYHQSDQDRMKLDRFKVRTLIVGVDGETKEDKK